MEATTRQKAAQPMPPLDHNTGRNSFKMILRQPLLLTVIIAIFLVLFIFVLAPIFNVLKLGLMDQDGNFTFENAKRIIQSSSYMSTFGNSIQLGVIVALCASVVGYIFAFAINKTEMPGRKFFKVIAMIPMISPPFILSLSMIFLFGRYGLITRELLGIKGNDVYGMTSLIVIQTISYFPIAYLTLSGILQSLDPSVEDAAYSMGARRGRIFRTVTLPLSMPGVVSAFLLVFIQSLEDFSNPAVIGGDFSTLAVETYRTITGLFDMNTGAMLSVLLLLPTVAAFLFQRYWVQKKSFVTVLGKPTQARRKLHEPYIIWPLFAFCCLVTLVIFLFYGTVLVGAFVKTWGVDYTFTWKNFEYIRSAGWDALKNSVTLAAYAAPVGGLLGMIVAYLTVRKRFPGRKVMETASMLMFAIPGTVLGISYITTFNVPPLVLTGTSIILVAAFVFRNMPVAMESGTTTLLQIDPSIDEASAVLGAGSGYTFRRITLPLLRNAFFSGLVYAFVRSITAVSAIMFLVSPRWSLATTKIYSLFEIGLFSYAAAYSVIMIAIILFAIGVINLIVRVMLNPRARGPRKKRKAPTPQQFPKTEGVQ
ncbi:iron ABC transporter permease [Christensenellaceae bacterium OttesenSCG-928-L17]|nr:iron ABC transporter permease [Christensenellaceae bacterium OttesenSCG-928-L17]